MFLFFEWILFRLFGLIFEFLPIIILFALFAVFITFVAKIIYNIFDKIAIFTTYVVLIYMVVMSYLLYKREDVVVYKKWGAIAFTVFFLIVTFKMPYDTSRHLVSFYIGYAWLSYVGLMIALCCFNVDKEKYNLSMSIKFLMFLALLVSSILVNYLETANIKQSGIGRFFSGLNDIAKERKLLVENNGTLPVVVKEVSKKIKKEAPKKSEHKKEKEPQKPIKDAHKEESPAVGNTENIKDTSSETKENSVEPNAETP